MPNINLGKVRIGVLAVAGMVTFLTYQFGTDLVVKLPEDASEIVLSMLVGIGLGGLVATIGQLLSPDPDKPAPTVPASTHERALDLLEKALNRS